MDPRIRELETCPKLRPKAFNRLGRRLSRIERELVGVLSHLRDRGMRAPVLAVADGALGFWSAFHFGRHFAGFEVPRVQRIPYDEGVVHDLSRRGFLQSAVKLNGRAGFTVQWRLQARE